MTAAIGAVLALASLSAAESQNVPTPAAVPAPVAQTAIDSKAAAASSDKPLPYAVLRPSSLETAKAEAKAEAKAKAKAKAEAKDAPVVRASIVPDWMVKATLYHFGAKGVGNRDSLGCTPVAMRTVAVDPMTIPRRTVLFIAETVGLPLPGGGVHDGLWYASDTGGKIKGGRVDLFTGHGRESMKPIFKLNLKQLSAKRVGTFKGCPKR